jgi:BirA family biotin operon repressor/biotin-[acetyl-CoA-carboxylase] ligase
MQPNRQFHWFPSIGSTMLAAAELASRGVASGTVVGADEQVAGQGRYGRVWHSEPEAGLYVSEVLRLSLAADELPVITLALGLATADAISRTCGVRCDLRWPNDVLIAQKKCAGILVQLHEPAVIAGIGVNVNHTVFPQELTNTATSLRLATGREQSREELLLNLVDSIDVHCDILAKEGREAILMLFSEHSSYVRGRRVIVDQGGASIEGTTEGLDESGFLIVRKLDGRRSLILAGGVRPAP